MRDYGKRLSKENKKIYDSVMRDLNGLDRAALFTQLQEKIDALVITVSKEKNPSKRRELRSVLNSFERTIRAFEKLTE